MKKFSILMLLFFSAMNGFSQSLDDINEIMGKKDYVNARTAIDKYLSDPKNSEKGDGWYFKGRIYNSLSYEKSIQQNELYDLKNTAFEAFKKYQQLDSKEVRMIFENHASYLDLYYGFYDLGANLFNSKDYSGAFNAFKKAIEVENYILGKKYVFSQATLNPLDTALVMNAAISATQAKKIDEGIPYYRKLTDANVTGEGYRDIYEYLVDYYNEKGDESAMKEILTKGKNFYPKDEFWNEIELKNIGKTGDEAALFAKYEEMIAKDPSNFTMAYNYAVVLYKKIYDKDAKHANDLSMKDKLTATLKSAITKDPEIDATVLLAGHLYSMAANYFNDASMIKGTKPDDVKKKNELKALANKKLDECIPYSENAIKYFENKTDLKIMQTANYKIILSNLSDIYSMKGDKKKSDEYEKKRAAIK